MVDAETAADTFKLDDNSRDQLRRLFEQSDEWQYSGAHNGRAEFPRKTAGSAGVD